MRIVLFAGIAAIVAGGVYLHGPLRDGETYNRSLDDAYEAVRNVPMPRMFAGIVNDVPGGSVKMDYEDRKSITWRFTAKGKEGALFKVEFAPLDDPEKVYVTTSYERLEADELLFDGRDPLMGDPELFHSVGRVAMREQIDSKLEHRPYDSKRVQEVLAAWTMKNMHKIQTGISNEMNKAAANFDEMDAARERSKNAAEARAFASGKPMSETMRERNRY